MIGKDSWFGTAAKIGAVCLLLAWTQVVHAVQVRISVSPERVTVGQQFMVVVEVQGEGVGQVPRPTLPEHPQIRRTGQYESRNFSYVNGRMTGSLAVRYVMVGLEPGNYELGPATVQSGDESVASNPVNVEVLAAGSSANVGPGSSGGGPAGPSPGTPQPGAPPRAGGANDAAVQSGGKDIFVVAEVNDKTPYVNQQITYTFTFLRRAGIQIFQGSQYAPPEATGFWKEELDTTEPTEVVIDGKQYIAERVRIAYFPTGPGEFTIGEANLTTSVAEMRSRRRDPFDIFGQDPFGFFREGREVRLQTNPIKIRVQPLPEESKPSDFCGGVGKFTLESSVDKTLLKAGDPATLTLKLFGEGNVKVIPAPDLSQIDGFKIYESESHESSAAAGGKIRGEKSWQFVLVPTTGGIAEIPAIHLSVFNPETRAYETLQTKPIPVTVEATALDEALSRGEGLEIAKEKVRLRERDIRYLKDAPTKFRRAGGRIPISPTLLLQHAVPALLFGGALYVRRRKDRMASDVRWARSQKARGIAEKTLQESDKALRAGDLELFHGALSKALRGYVADRLHVSSASLDLASVRDELVRRGLTTEQFDELTRMIAHCDLARYSPQGKDVSRAAELLREARNWVANFAKLAVFLGFVLALVAPDRSLAGTSADWHAAFDRGMSAYESGDFEAAQTAFREILEDGVDDAVVHYNVANASFKVGKLGEAIFHYRKAKALAPRDEDVEANLEYARFLARDTTEGTPTDETRSETWASRLTPEEIFRWTPHGFAAACVLGIVGLFVPSRLRKPTRQLAMAGLVLWAVAATSSAVLAAWNARDPEGVVLAKSVDVRTGPATNLPVAFVLHEGAEVTIQGTRGSWVEIALSRELHGWVEESGIARLEYNLTPQRSN